MSSFSPSTVQSTRPQEIHDEFLELAVHDLDSPVRKLFLLTDRLKERSSELEVPADLLPYIERVSNCAADIRSLIDDLHLLTGITHYGARFFPCDMNIMIQDVLQELSDLVKQKDAIIQVDPLPVPEGDKRLLSLLLKNLLRNALVFSRDNVPPLIEIRSSEIPAAEVNELQLLTGKIYYRVDITDNGVGIKKEDHEKIFDPFVKLYSKALFPGNGMGLAMCRKIMDVHHGVLFAAANGEEGSVFSFIIPQNQ